MRITLAILAAPLMLLAASAQAATLDRVKESGVFRVGYRVDAPPFAWPHFFERLGYFTVDTQDSTPEHPVFNRTATLRDTWARVQQADKR